jgi:REP element-mobilizing transposase RayT
MSEQLYFMHLAFGVEIHCFVLMTNHFHLLMSTPLGNLSTAMAVFMRETSRAITKSTHRINQTYGQRHFRSIVHTPSYYLHAYKYFYFNPVKAGICNRVEDYKYSTLRGLLGLDHLLIPVKEDHTLFSDVEGTLQWLNRRPSDENWESVRKALRRERFTLPRIRTTRDPNQLEFNTL